MFSITEYLTHEHRECDELYARVEELLKKDNGKMQREPLRSLRLKPLNTFKKEEDVLFPEFEGEQA
jgi:hypothetical protein